MREGFEMNYAFRDVFEFQEKYPSREEREQALKKMDPIEIQRLIQTCGTKQGKIYYNQFAILAAEREKEKVE